MQKRSQRHGFLGGAAARLEEAAAPSDPLHRQSFLKHHAGLTLALVHTLAPRAPSVPDTQHYARYPLPQGDSATAGPLAAAAGMVERVMGDVQRARGALGKRLANGPTLTEEVLQRSGALPVVLVPASYSGRGEAGATPEAGASGDDSVQAA